MRSLALWCGGSKKRCALIRRRAASHESGDKLQIERLLGGQVTVRRRAGINFLDVDLAALRQLGKTLALDTLRAFEFCHRLLRDLPTFDSGLPMSFTYV